MNPSKRSEFSARTGSELVLVFCTGAKFSAFLTPLPATILEYPALSSQAASRGPSKCQIASTCLFSLRRRECLVEVSEDVVDMFDTNRKPNIAGGHAGLQLLLRGQL